MEPQVYQAVFGIAGLIILIYCLFNCFVVTKQKKVTVLETFGKFSGTRSAGLKVKWPWPIQICVDTVDLKIRELAETVEVKSLDNAFLRVPVKVQLKIMPSKVEQAYYSLDDPMRQVLSYVVNQVRAKAATMGMDQIFSSKNDFETTVEEELKERFSAYGFQIVNVLVDDPEPSDELKAAFEKVLAAQRDMEAAEKEKNAIRARTVGVAEAEAESLKIKAEAYSQQRNEMARGNSEAIATFCKDLDITHKEALQFFEGWDVRDAIRDAARGEGNTVLIPVNMGSDLGDLAVKLEALKGVK